MAAGLIIPMVIGFVVSSLAISSPLQFTKSDIGTLWQVEGALIGLAIALAIYGYEAMGRGGAVEPAELAELRLPRAIYLGISLIALTGLAFLGLPDTDEPAAQATFQEWIAAACVVVAALWLAVLLRALPEVVRVTDPGFRMELRIARLLPLSRAAVERRLMELASAGLLRRLADETTTTLVPWVYLSGREQPDRLVRALRPGYVSDINFSRLRALLVATPETDFNLALGQRVEAEQVLALARTDVKPSWRLRWTEILALRSSPQEDPLDRVIVTLRDAAYGAIGARSDAVSEVLDAFLSVSKSSPRRGIDRLVAWMRTSCMSRSRLTGPRSGS